MWWTHKKFTKNFLLFRSLMLTLVCGKKFCEITLNVLTILLSMIIDKKHQIFSLNKLNSSPWYEILIDANKIKPTSQTYFENLFPNFKRDWKSIYLLPRRVTLDTNLRMFQYKLLNNVLYLNNMLFRFYWKLIPLSVHIVMKKKKLSITYFIPS